MFNVWRISRRQLSWPGLWGRHFIIIIINMMMKWCPAFFTKKNPTVRHFSFLKKAGRRALQKRPRQNTNNVCVAPGEHWNGLGWAICCRNALTKASFNIYLITRCLHPSYEWFAKTLKKRSYVEVCRTIFNFTASNIHIKSTKLFIFAQKWL